MMGMYMVVLWKIDSESIQIQCIQRDSVFCCREHQRIVWVYCYWKYKHQDSSRDIIGLLDPSERIHPGVRAFWRVRCGL